MRLRTIPSRSKAFTLASACALIFAVMVSVHAQSAAPNSQNSQAAPSEMTEWEKAAGGHLEFDVASVKENERGASNGPREMPTSNVPLAPGDTYAPTGGLLQAAHWPLIVYISFAYKLQADQLQAVASELPKWATEYTFDIEARAQGNPTKDQMRLMMQALLADRFKLALHREMREGPVFALALDKAGKFGPQLRQHVDDPPCPAATAASALPIATGTIAGGYPTECGSVVFIPATGKPGVFGFGGRNVSMGLIASSIGGAGKLIGDLGRPVIDGTGTTGTFDFRIDFAPQLPFGPKPDAEQAGPTFLEALKDELGLKLEPESGRVEEIVIDHVERPTPN